MTTSKNDTDFNEDNVTHIFHHFTLLEGINLGFCLNISE